MAFGTLEKNINLDEKTEEKDITVQRWISRERITFEIKNESDRQQWCEWSVVSNVPHFYGVPAPFTILPGEMKSLYFKWIVDNQQQTGPLQLFNYKLTFKLNANLKTQFLDEILCVSTFKPDFNLYLTSYLG
jgi:hypothetical protein